MDKVLSYIDIAQEDGTTNPSAGFSRVKAKTSEALVTRSSAGVEGALGGVLQVVSSVLSANSPAIGSSSATTFGISLSIPPGKSVNLTAFIPTASASPTVAANVGGGFRVSNPAGANGAVSGSWDCVVGPPNAAAASSSKDGDVFNLAAGATIDCLVTAAITPVGNIPVMVMARATISNLSTSTSAVIDLLTDSYANASFCPAGTGYFALIT